MKDRRHFIIPEGQHMRSVITDAVMSAPAGYHVDIGPDTRSSSMNRKFHAICRELSMQLFFGGVVRTIQEWKVLLVSGHSVAMGNQPDVVEGLEGELVNLRESTAQMSVSRMSSLIEYALYFCAENGVEVSDEYK